jgi:hypothetical protein
MDNFVKAHQDIIIEATLKSLEKHGFGARFFETGKEAADFIVKEAKGLNSVGVAGSHTVRATGVVDALEAAGKTMYDHWKHKLGTPEELECRKNQMIADLFLASANAITQTGEIVNRDGAGNRINAMTFGPKKVILVVGVNKITPHLDAAFDRLENVAGPIRAMSLSRKTPCVKTGACHDCDSPERICRITSIIHRKPMMTDLSIVIIREELGY